MSARIISYTLLLIFADGVRVMRSARSEAELATSAPTSIKSEKDPIYKLLEVKEAPYHLVDFSTVSGLKLLTPRQHEWKAEPDSTLFQVFRYSAKKDDERLLNQNGFSVIGLANELAKQQKYKDPDTITGLEDGILYRYVVEVKRKDGSELHLSNHPKEDVNNSWDDYEEFSGGHLQNISLTFDVHDVGYTQFKGFKKGANWQTSEEQAPWHQFGVAAKRMSQHVEGSPTGGSYSFPRQRECHAKDPLGHKYYFGVGWTCTYKYAIVEKIDTKCLFKLHSPLVKAMKQYVEMPYLCSATTSFCPEKTHSSIKLADVEAVVTRTKLPKSHNGVSTDDAVRRTRELFAAFKEKNIKDASQGFDDKNLRDRPYEEKLPELLAMVTELNNLWTGKEDTVAYTQKRTGNYKIAVNWALEEYAMALKAVHGITYMKELLAAINGGQCSSYEAA